MGLRDLIANGVALADKLTQDLQPEVQFEAFTGKDGFNQNAYAPALGVKAIVERKQKLVRTPAGEEVMSSHLITILRAIASNGAPGRQEPIDVRDRFTLADGSTGTILAIEGFDDRATDQAYFYQVYLAGA